MLSYKAEPLFKCRCTLGEGPVWWDSCLHWIDIEAKKFYRASSGQEQPKSFDLPSRPGAAAPLGGDNRWLLALEDGFHLLDPQNANLEKIAEVEGDKPENRCNDGKADPHGRFIAGTMNMKGQAEAGGLYRLDSNGTIAALLKDLTIPNGLDWDRNSENFYHIDTPTRLVMGYHYDKVSGILSNGAPCIRIDDDYGYPDGMCIDTNGCLWIAMWGGEAVRAFDPRTGKQIAEVKVSAPNVTSCCFGGDDLKTLYITTAGAGLSEEARKTLPHAGDVFSCKLDVSGYPPYTYNFRKG